MAKRDRRGELLDELGQIADRLEETDALYARRLEIFEELRALDPPVLHREIANAARISEIAVTQALLKARRQRAS